MCSSDLDDAVEKIVDFWESNRAEKYAGIIALDATPDYKVIGSLLPKQAKAITQSDFYLQGGTGDKKLIYRTDVINKYPPYPLFEGEKYVGLSYKYMMVDDDYKMLILNEVVCLVEYLEDGSSLNIIHQYRKNPKGFAELRKVSMQRNVPLKMKFKDAIHYVSSCLISKNKQFLKETPCKMLTLLSIPFGVLLYIFSMKTNKDTVI